MKQTVKIKGVPEFSLDVTQGMIHINSISILQATSSVIYLSADSRQKYPADGDGGSFNEVIVTKSSRTLGVDKRRKKNTIIHIDGLDEEGWRFIGVSTGRYTVSWCYVNMVCKNMKKVFEQFQWVDK